MTRQEIKETFINQVLFGRENYWTIPKTASEVEESDSFTDTYAMDSLDCVGLLMEAEGQFHVNISDEIADTCDTVGKAIDAIHTLINQ